MAHGISPVFQAELKRLDLLLHREILRLRASYQLSLDEFRGLYISDEQVDRLVNESLPQTNGDETIAKLTREAEAMRQALGETPLDRAARMFDLTPFERDVLLLALAPELDVKYDTLYAYLNNDVTRKHPTVDLALRLFASGQGHNRSLLGPSARLFAQGLVESTDSGTDRRSSLGAGFGIAPALAAWMQGMVPWDPRLSGWVESANVEGKAWEEPLLGVSTETKIEQMATVLRHEPSATVVVIESMPGHCADVTARRLFQTLGKRLLRLDGARMPADPPLATLALVARLGPSAVFVDVEQWTGEHTRRLLSTLLSQLHRAGIAVVLAVAPESLWRRWTGSLPAVCLPLTTPDARERQALWALMLGQVGVEADDTLLWEVADRFRLGPAQIAGAAKAVRSNTLLNGSSNSMRERLFQAAKDQSIGDLGQLATRIRQNVRWPDLVLPPVVLGRLKEVTYAIRSRTTVFQDWGFAGRGGSGLMVLFSGVSGTGKTMSASVISREIGLDLYRIDLASVVSKYIGETEKNLQRVFEAARSANVILFFDEADALLGKRSEVKDAHDRYANIEIAYLLQKMEDHDGVVILATNLSRNMDQAFSRRMHYVVEFPRPDGALREHLWGQIFPPQVPLAEDVDFAFLGRQFELTGGDIKTVAMDAAFSAAGQGRALGMADLLGATARQMLKQGKPLAASDFKQYHGQIPTMIGLADKVGP